MKQVCRVLVFACACAASAQSYVSPEFLAPAPDGGAFVTEVYGRLEDAVMVEDLCSGAALGMDIGDTLIGMHLRPVAVPVHTAFRRIGEANIVMARTRPRYIGGPRAHYPEGSGA